MNNKINRNFKTTQVHVFCAFKMILLKINKRPKHEIQQIGYGLFYFNIFILGNTFMQKLNIK